MLFSSSLLVIVIIIFAILVFVTTKIIIITNIIMLIWFLIKFYFWIFRMSLLFYVFFTQRFFFIFCLFRFCFKVRYPCHNTLYASVFNWTFTWKPYVNFYLGLIFIMVKETYWLTYERLIIIEDLLGPKTLRNLQPFLYTMGCCWNNSIWWNGFSCKLVGYQSPLSFTFCQIVGLVFQTRYVSIYDWYGDPIHDWTASFLEKCVHISRTISYQFKCWKYCFQA